MQFGFEVKIEVSARLYLQLGGIAPQPGPLFGLGEFSFHRPPIAKASRKLNDFWLLPRVGKSRDALRLHGRNFGGTFLVWAFFQICEVFDESMTASARI